MGTITALLTILIPLGLGYGLTRLILKNSDYPIIFLLALGYGLGLGCISQWILLLGVFKIPINILSCGVPIAFTALIFTAATIRRCKNSSEKREKNTAIREAKKETVLRILLWGYILFQIIFIFWRTLNIPIQSYDPLVFISFKAKAIFFDEGFRHLNFLIHPGYPLLTELSQTWIAVSLGHWSETFVKIIFPFFLFSYVIVQYEFLKKFTDTLWALAGCVLLFSANILTYHAAIAYRDIPMMYYNCSSILLLILWGEGRGRDNRLLFLCGLFSALTCLVKSEGICYWGIHFLLLLIITLRSGAVPFSKGSLKKIMIFILPAILLYSLFSFYKITSQRPEALITVQTDFSVASLIGRLSKTILSFLRNFFISGNWNILWTVFFMSLIIYSGKAARKHPLQILSLALGFFLALYICLSVFTSKFVYIGGDLSGVVLTRVITHFFPLIVILIILLNARLKNREENGGINS